MNAMRPMLRPGALRSSTARAASLGLAMALTFLLTGDRGVRSATGSGIDPLDILKLQVRPNAIIVLDSSGSMRQRPEATSDPPAANPGPTAATGANTVGDDADSKVFKAKAVIKTVVTNNQTKVNFMFGKYTQDLTSAGLSPETPTFLYKVNCPLPLTSACNVNANAISITAFGTAGLRRTPASDVFTETNGSKTYYLQSTTFRNGIQVNTSSAGACGTPCTTTTGAPAKADPAPVQVKVGTGTPAIFYFQGVRWRIANNITTSCGGFQPLVNLQACTVNDQITAVNPYLKKEAVTATSGANIGDILNPNGTVWDGATNTLYAVDGGVRASGSTPIGGSLDDIKTQFDATIWPGRPNPAQRTFVIFLTDGNERCNGDYRNAAYAAQKLYNAGATDVTKKVETFMVVFGAGVDATEANQIAYGGSGMTAVPNNGTAWTRDATAAEVAACATCRGAFTAATSSDLEKALQAAIDQGANAGEFSDQQSITESIFELGATAGVTGITPLDPTTRYNATVPVLLQSTFELPNYSGHLNAFRNAAGVSVQLWDAADRLCTRVTGYPATTTGTPVTCNVTGAATSTTNMGNGVYTFPTLTGNGAFASARIQRRIYSTTQNGVNAGHTPQNLVNESTIPMVPVDTFTAGTSDLLFTGGLTPGLMAQIWPPDKKVDPAKSGSSFPAGSLDAAMGITAMTTAEMNALGACVVTLLPTAGVLTSDCGTTGYIQKETRQIILAFAAGAQLSLGADNKPARTAGPASTGGLLQYAARKWMLAESTLAAPAIAAPPLQTTTSVHGTPEYLLYRDGPRDVTKKAVNAVAAGFGLRNPDDDGQTTSKNDLNLKPSMTVVYHATNFMLHALRAAPCFTGVTSCTGETGGEELWAFVPFDQLGKLRERMKTQTRTSHTYVLAAPARLADVFVPGNFSRAFSGVTASGNGVWRTLLLFGRGAGGKYLTALDVTVPGPFTKAALTTNPPIVVWSRGNPDTNDGKAKTAANAYNNVAADYNAYLKMGETWSVPAIGYGTAASNLTARKPTAGVEYLAWVGSGYSDVAGEGTTFFALAALSGDVINDQASPAAYDVGSAGGVTTPPNALVAGPSAFAVKPFSFNDPNSPNIANPASEKVTAVYFPDLHGRVWKFNPETPGTAPALFATLTGTGVQAVANPVSLLYMSTDGSPKPHVFVESGNDSRLDVPPTGTAIFRMFGFRDNAGTAEVIDGFPIDFPSGYRGVVQPATAFNSKGFGRVFFAGIKFNPPGADCASSFDSVLFALQAATGDAAYDFGGADDRSVTLTNQRINAIRTAGGLLVADLGLGAQNAPPPPAPASGISSAPSPRSSVSVGSTIPGAVAFKQGYSVCR